MPAVDIDLVLKNTMAVHAEYLDEVESTNDYAKQIAGAPDSTLPLLVLADQQTAGRGRGAKLWWSAEGSLTFSLLVDPARWTSSRQEFGLVALAAGLAVVEAVRPFLASHLVGLHWPNDVYADGKKLAGILIESPCANRLIIGIGLNWNNRFEVAPADVRGRGTSVGELTGQPQNPTNGLIAVLQRLEAMLDTVKNEPARIIELADLDCSQRGRTLAVQSGDRVVEGRCLGISAGGALRLKTPEGIVELISGTVLSIR